ncbi:Cell division protein FtsH [Geitlerinema sp. FC II]|nr:Cell division protein FtsH [Geitlerinema sp. FC II]
MAELTQIGFLLKRYVENWRATQESDFDDRGLYISPAEVDRLLFQLTDFTPRSRSKFVRREVEELSERIEGLKNASLERDIPLRLHRFARTFGLSRFEINVVLLCLIPELDLCFEQLYAYLQDDATQKYPSVDLVLNLLASSPIEKIQLRQYFSTGSRLFEFQILDKIADRDRITSCLLGSYLSVDPSIVDYLLESPICYPHADFVRCDRLLDIDLDELFLDTQSKQSLMAIFEVSDLQNQQWRVYLQGNCSIEIQYFVSLVCCKFNLDLIRLDFRVFLNLELKEFDRELNRILRDAKLNDCAVAIAHFDAIFDESNEAYAIAANFAFCKYPIVLVFSGTKPWDSRALEISPTVTKIPIPKLDAIARLNIWKTCLENPISPEVDRELPIIASKFRFQREQIQNAAIEASHLAYWRNAADPQITRDDLYEACRLQSSSHLESLARRIVPRRQWFDLVLPSDRCQQLKEICRYVKYRTRVYEQWGFDRKLSSGKGLTALFSGAPGTGKTMAAEVLAGDLGLELYKIDLSSVVSKYIGETEKHLSRIFEAGEASNAILFFDEADALFGKRTQVSDARDRYANIEVSYLLQRLEEYEGIVILATNFRRNMDDAFLRRLHFTIDFPLPTEKERQLIWERILPEELPRSENLDLAFMASQFELAGGNIRNIALTGAFLAAEENSEMTTSHLIRATQREYQKMGKVLRDEEFGKYADSI